MQTVTITFTNSKRQQEAVTYNVWQRSELSEQERFDLLGNGARGFRKGNWADDEDFVVEKQAALAAGLKRGAEFILRRVKNG